jgi:hypothetical protein
VSPARPRAVTSALLCLGALALLAPACGTNQASTPAAAEGTSATTPTTTSPSTTTTTVPLPPGGRLPTAEEPLRVLLAGDSVMADVSLAVASTLNDGGHAVTRLVTAPSVPRDEATRSLWREQLDAYDPEVVVVLIGVWESMAEGALARQPLGSRAWERTYRRDALEPYVNLLTSDGAEVIWIGMPPVLNLARQLAFSSMNRAVRHLADASPDLTYVPGDELLARRDGAWADVLLGPQGNPQRVRRLDTTHLCADGAERLARPVLRLMARRWAVPLAENWPEADWRWVFPPAECPPT